MFALPASGASVALRIPDGRDEMLLSEGSESVLDAAIALLSRLGGEGFDAGALSVTDFETLLLRLRMARFGPTFALGFTCPQCRAIAEIGFNASDLIEAAQPRRPARVADDPGRPGWFRIAEGCFRLPTARDQAEVAGHPHPERRLAERCLDDAARASGHRAKVERAMEAMAPLLSRQIAGSCPSCDVPVRPFMSIPGIVLHELRRAAAAIYEEIHLIARAYHWPEAAILSLSGGRRRAYAELIRRASPLAAA